MTNHKLGRWLLVALAIVGLAVAAPVVSAHGDETAVDDTHPGNETDDDWAWMAAQMSEHMGPDGAEWMEGHMGVTGDEAAQAHATTDHVDGTHGHATTGHDNDAHGHVDDGTDGHC